MIERILCAAIAFATLAPVTSAQMYGGPRPMRTGTTLLNMPTTSTLSAGQWEVRFAHRFAEAINDGDAHSLWGLDGSADIAFGVAWGPTSRTELSILRTDVQDDVEVALKRRFGSQIPGRIAFAARIGADVRTERDLTDRTSGFAQIIISRQFGDALELSAIPSWASKAGSFDNAFNLPVAIAWAFRRDTILVVELIPENRDLPSNVSSSFGWTVGIKKAVGGHYFDLILSNSRATHVSQYVSSEVLPGLGLEAGDVHLGFNIVRLFGGR